MSNLKSLLLLIVIVMSLLVKGQIPFYEDSLHVAIEDTNTRIFLTQGDSLIVSNNPISNKIFREFKVYMLKQEFPTALSLYLQKVYIMVCDCDVEILMDTLKKHKTIFGEVYRIGIGQVTINERISTNTDKTILFPNPFQKEIFVNNPDKDDFDYELVNFLGIRVKTGKLLGTENRLDLSTIEQGIYLLNLKSGTSKVKTYKIIKGPN